MSKKHLGSSVDDFLKEEGTFEEARTQAIKEVVAWQLAQAMKERKISKNRMATLLKTSRTQVDRLLDAKNDITLSSLQRAAATVGRRVEIRLVWPKEASMSQNKFPDGWDEARVQRVLAHYENQSEDEAGGASSGTMMNVPHDLVSKVRELIAKRAS